MKSLAGHNILLVEKNKQTAQKISDGMTEAGANLFVAHNLLDAQKLQDQWDIDIVISEISFLVGLGDLVSMDSNRWSGKSAPMTFGYGKKRYEDKSILQTRGVLEVFDLKASTEDFILGMMKFLFDPKEHIKNMASADHAKQISLILTNASDKWILEVQQLSDDGLTAFVEGDLPVGETAVLTVCFPDEIKSPDFRFAVRLEKISDKKENLKLKILHKEKNRWKEFLSLIATRQVAIDNFLLMSSGR